MSGSTCKRTGPSTHLPCDWITSKGTRICRGSEPTVRLKATLHNHNRRIQKLKKCNCPSFSFVAFYEGPHSVAGCTQQCEMEAWKLYKNKGRPGGSWKSQTSFKGNDFPGFTRNLVSVPLRGEKKNLKLPLMMDTQLLGIGCDLAAPASHGQQEGNAVLTALDPPLLGT